MTEQEQAEVMAIEAEIKNLDAEFESWQENRGDVSGTQRDVYQLSLIPHLTLPTM